MDRLAERAAEWGIDPDYVDAQGRLRKVDGDALCHIIDAVSCGAKPRPRTLLPPIAVIRRGRKADLALPDIAASSAVRWTISADGGEIACGIADSGRVALP